MRNLTHAQVQTILVDYNNEDQPLQANVVNQGKASTYINKLERSCGYESTVLLKNLEDNEQEVSIQPTQHFNATVPTNSIVVVMITRIVKEGTPLPTKEEALQIGLDHIKDVNTGKIFALMGGRFNFKEEF